jgi:hypothetical protein
MNTQLRKEASSVGDDFGVSLYKLMNNAVFGKTMENVRDRVDIKLYTDEKLVQKQIAKPQFENSKVFDDDLVAIKCVKAKCVLDKPIYVGVTILELSKLTMYKFH